MKRFWKDEKPPEIERIIRMNNPSFNNQFQYANNHISTSKYSIISFLPKNLFEQFQRLANTYFLGLMILQFIPVISSLTYLTTVIPLVLVLLVTAIKDAWDDFIRHRSDAQVNNRKSEVLREGELTSVHWHTVVVGDIIRLENNDFVAADLLLLSTSEPNSLCYIETAELDGETNLKVREALQDTADIHDDQHKMSQLDAEITCEAPNVQLNKFEGRMMWNGETYALDNDNILLRGCVLRNTRWCYGLVVFAGSDTKLMKNSGRTAFKRTRIDRLMNTLIIGIFLFLLSLCFFCTVACGIFEGVIGYNFEVFLPRPDFVSKNKDAGSTTIAVLIFLSYIIILNTVVPISLYVTVEIIRLVNSMWINWDKKMYYEKKDTPAKARTTTLSEELGQIEYIFSDKTGTLTQNVMTFNRASIAAKRYGDVIDDMGNIVDITETTPKVDFSENTYAEKTFSFYDQELLEAARGRNPEVEEFFRLLSLCHTVMPETKDDGYLEYQAQSPDEGALVSAARNFGYVFKSRTPNSVTIEVHGKEEVYELLCILDFDNVRKRMSVLLRRDGKMTLYCKGADSVIFERLDPKCADLQEKTLTHLNTNVACRTKFAWKRVRHGPVSNAIFALQAPLTQVIEERPPWKRVWMDPFPKRYFDTTNEFAQLGLRTLCCSSKDIDEEYYNAWKRRYHEASTSMENREDKMNAVYDEIEQNMKLIGASAIEDKLQDGVPDAIANLALAGIKIWVLTGDKQETAINIGYSCRLLTEEMGDPFIIAADTSAGVEEELTKALNDIHSITSSRQSLDSTSSQENAGFAIVINGHSLAYALKPNLEMLLLEVGSLCKAVICCRVTPLQKALVVDLVKQHKKCVTLAIGDGANDVSMIKMAHIGVGISGQEGMQAVLASDFSMAQFRYLERLLLVHGRWSYIRMCKFLRYFFYKNFAFTLCHFWFAFFCGFSAQTLYDPFFITCYNVFYTSLPVIAMGVFDQDVNEEYSLRFPKLYEPGLKDALFNKEKFMHSVLEGILSSAILFFIPYATFYYGIGPSGHTESDLQSFGCAVASILVVAVNIRCAIDINYWTGFNHLVVWGSIVFYFCFIMTFYADAFRYTYSGVALRVFSTANFWFSLFLTCAFLLLPVIAYRFAQSNFFPTLTDKVRLLQRTKKTKYVGMAVHRGSTRRSKYTSQRSGYAFAHQHGFGDLITTGRAMHEVHQGKAGTYGAIHENGFQAAAVAAESNVIIEKF